MRKTVRHLPKNKRDEIDKLLRLIHYKVPQAEMVILFGSYARGEWVEDIYVDGGNTYEYNSDFDILIIVKSNQIANSTNLWSRLERSINTLTLSTPVTIIPHDINFINKRLRQAHYFFSDIKKEGIMLYDSGDFKLERIGRLRKQERAKLAKEDFNQWMTQAKDFNISYEALFKSFKYNLAAFILHQISESLFSAIVLVFTNYKPKSHDLDKLNRLACGYHPAFIPAFSYKTPEEKENFKLLNRAYVDARYKKDYKITKEQLEFLAARIEQLQYLVEKVCKEKIKSFLEV